MPKFSANLGFLWRELPLLERIAAAGRAGFAAVVMDWPYAVPADKLASACKAAGVTLLGVNTPAGQEGEFGTGALPGREREFAESVDKSLEYCRATGAMYVHAMAGLAEDNAANARTFVANLAAAAKRAADEGVMIVLEPLNPHDRPGYFHSRIERTAEIIAATGQQNVRVMFDFYHIARSQGDVVRLLKAYLPIIGHIQIASIPSRCEPDEGEVDYAAVIKEIDRLGYSGWIDCEYRPRGNIDEGLSWVGKLGFSLKEKVS